MAELPDCPLPLLEPPTNRIDEFDRLLDLLNTAKAYFERGSPAPPTVRDKLHLIGLARAIETVGVFRGISEEQSLWRCVCARPLLEYSLRLLWAAREAEGYSRMYAYYATKQETWLRKLAQRDAEWQPHLDDILSKAPSTSLPTPMPDDMRTVMSAIGTRDKADGVDSFQTDQSHYDSTIAFLHSFVHLNPIVTDSSASSSSHASHALVEAVLSLCRSLGYQLNWSQQGVFYSVLRVAYLATLSADDRAKILKELNLDE